MESTLLIEPEAPPGYERINIGFTVNRRAVDWHHEPERWSFSIRSLSSGKYKPCQSD
jgi:hypothetical protein